jgi:hypothetical protein
MGDTELEEQYGSAWIEWSQSEDSALWDALVGDGLEDDDDWP